MDLWLEFLGYFLSEGHTHHRVRELARVNKDGSHVTAREYAVGISQQKASNLDVIGECLRQLPFRFNKTATGWMCYDQSLWREVQPFGKAPDKYIPDYAKTLSRRQQKILYESLMLGDGCVSACPTGDKVTYYTSSRRLADDMQELLLKIGYCGDITHTNRVGQVNSSGNTYREVEYRVGIKRTATAQAKKGGWIAGLQQYSGKVYCVTVPNHVVYVRRNGRAAWCGNSWNNLPQVWPEEIYGPWPVGSFWVAEDQWEEYFLGSGSIFFYCDIAGVPRKNLPDYGFSKGVWG
jgi:intein/homing endonuclease